MVMIWTSTRNSPRRLARNSARNARFGAAGVAAGAAACLLLAAGIAGCRVQVDKGPNGEDKKAQVATPFGGMHVTTDETSAASLGLPVYPGAEIVKDNDNDKT